VERVKTMPRTDVGGAIRLEDALNTLKLAHSCPTNAPIVFYYCIEPPTVSKYPRASSRIVSPPLHE